MAFFAAGLIFSALIFLAPPARTQVYEKVFSFADARAVDFAAAKNKGSSIYAGLVLGNDGNFYGTTSQGGANDYGTVFKMTPAGVVTTLVEFSNTAGGNRPWGGLVQGNDGNFYGTTLAGVGNQGTVFKMTPTGALTNLALFNGSNGSQPTANLIQASNGNFYGTTSKGGTNSLGTVFKMTPAGGLTTLVNFTGKTGSNKGNQPNSALVQGTDGNFYGTTIYGGASDNGTVFKMTPAGVLTTLVEFTGYGSAAPMGHAPWAGLVQGTDGNFYGTTVAGGAYGYGTVFKMTSDGVLTTLVSFKDYVYSDGAGPFGTLMLGADGNFYGTAQNGGIAGQGTVFRMTPAGELTVLVKFNGSEKDREPRTGLVQGSDGNFYGTTSGSAYKVTPVGGLTTLVEFMGIAGGDAGSQPAAGLIQGGDGNFYGTTQYGGTNNIGTVFKMTPGGELTTLAECGSGNNISQPAEGMVLGGDGNFYGTTPYGGYNYRGTAFKMTPTGKVTTLLQFGFFNNFMQMKPEGGLVQGSDGNFYGTTKGLGPSTNYYGTVFKMTPAGELTTLVEFTGTTGSKKGSFPQGRLVQGSDGNFYGTTQDGGEFDIGTIFKVSPTGEFTTLVEFNWGTGNTPLAGLIQGSDGNFYGTTNGGGANSCGTVFKMTPDGVLTTLVEFTGTTGSNRGSTPQAGLMQGNDGKFYGTTYGGGVNGYGTVFKMTPDGVLTTLMDATTSSEGLPMAPLVQASDGTLYGTMGGPDGCIYRLIFPGAPLIFSSSTEVRSRSSAIASARINAAGSATAVVLESGTDGVSFPNSIPVATNLLGFQTKLVGTTLSSLAEGGTYYYRFRATSSSGTTVSPVTAFTTITQVTAMPTVATQLQQTSAQFNGTVNAHSYDATVVFQYGTDGNSFPNTVAAVPGVVIGNADTAVSAAVAGLTKGTTYYYRIMASNAGGTTVTGATSFTTLTEPTATVGGVTALSTTSVRVDGALNPQGSQTNIVFEYGTDGVNFPNSVAAIPGTAAGNADTPVSAVLTNLSQGSTYYYRVKGTSSGGVGTSPAASFTMNVLSGFAQVFPGAPPEAQGYVFVTLVPSGINSGWRFVGEQQWRASGVPVSGLTTGDRLIEYRPVPGYIQPLQESISVISGGEATLVTGEYYPTTGGDTGGLSVVLKPDALADAGVPVDQRAQWRFLGEDDTQWRDTGETVSGLLPGNYLLESKPITGRATPAVINVPVDSGATKVATATYFLASTATGTAPAVLSFDTVSNNHPYAYVGQIRSDVGAGTGFVVKPRVVATAAHVVFDDGTLSYVTGLQWLFQRDRGTFEPTPQVPRGFYVFDGYATQRTADATPGVSTPQSQNLDAAALYFLEDAGRGGYGGYLASDLDDNEFLLSTKLKMLAGYPVDGIATLKQGRMHATPAANVAFTKAYGRTFTTLEIRSAGGNSGGPLCVQADNGNYYPAAIYLGGSAQTVVRAIDSQVIDLFNRAEVSGNGGDNSVGGGITQVNTPTGGGAFASASIVVNIQPAGAVAGGAKWIMGSSARTSGTRVNNLGAGTYAISFSSVANFLPQIGTSATLTRGNLTTITATYYGITAQPAAKTATAGGSATFTVGVSGTPSAYQWRRNGTNIAGATSPSYTRTGLTTADSGNYSVVVTWGSSGSLTSNAAALDVTAQAQTITFNALANKTYGDAPFTVSATASSGLAPTFSVVSGPATITGNTVTLTGTGTVTIRASQAGDGNYAAAADVDRSFLVTGTPLDAWRAQKFSATELLDALQSGPAADYDHDGINNLLEYALNMEPKTADVSTMIADTGTSGLPLVRVENVGGQDRLTVEYVRRRAASTPGITYTVEFNSDLSKPVNWTATGTETATPIDGTWERVKTTDQQSSSPSRFGRLKVTQP